LQFKKEQVMNVRTKLFVVLAAVAAPAAAFAATPASAGAAEAAARSGYTASTTAPSPQSAAAFTRRFRDAVAGGAGYTDGTQIAADGGSTMFEVNPSTRAVFRGLEERAGASYGLTSYDAAPLRE
jgi:hypothetical protein